MIKLIGEDVSITVKPDNPVYKFLQMMEGTSLQVIIEGEEKTEIKKEPEPEEVQNNIKSIDKSKVWSKFFEEIPWSEDKETPITYRLLKGHLDLVLHGDLGTINLEEESPGIYKKDNMYLVGNY